MLSQYTPMIQQYLTIKEQAQDAFLFFRLGDFYELFFEDAKLASEELEITLTSRDGGGNRPIPMCGVPHHSAPTYIQKLINKGHKVAICDQVEDPSVSKGVVKREIVRVITPGTIMEESMLAEQENNFLVCVTEGGGSFALAAADLSTGECYIAEVKEESLLYNEISFYQPREILVDEVIFEKDLMNTIHLRTKALITPIAISSVNENLLEALEKQYDDFQEVCCSESLKHVMKLLYGYLYKTQRRSLEHLRRLQRYESNQYMIMDDSARRNLELTMSLDAKKKTGSLLWFLNRTATAMGGRLLKRWLDKPLLRVEEIRNRQEIVKTFTGDLLLLDELKAMLKKVYDLERLAGRISYGTANARDLNSLRSSLSIIPDLKKLLSCGCSSLTRVAELLDPCTDIVNTIQRAIVEDPPISLKEGNVIRDQYNDNLDELRDIQRNGKRWITQLEQREREETGIKSLKIGYNRVFGYYIEITKSNLKVLQEGRYHRKQTLANAERFVTAELKEKEDLILTATEKATDMEYELFVQIRDDVSKEIARIQKVSELIARLDILHAFAVIATENQYVCPIVHNQDYLMIEEGRHPVVESMLREKEFTANNVELNSTNQQIHLITGPNMAGKSTYMRQVALITILSQIGSFVPAKKAEISIVDRIFTRIGAADDLIGGRSTFMVEMEETCRALCEATPRSLILLDEIGRGTSTYDGIALAQAIIEYIHDEIGAKTLFSTHYHELTNLEDELSRLVNVHAKCIEKDDRVVFLHRIVAGGADRSYGIYVAELAGIPSIVIEKAKIHLSNLEEQLKTMRMASEQLNLFSCAREETSVYATEKQEVLSLDVSGIIERIKSLDVVNTSPMEAMLFLNEIAEQLNRSRS